MAGDTKRILLVSNDNLLASEIDRMLATGDGILYELNTIYPIEKALKAIKYTEYSLVIMDIPSNEKCSEAIESLCASAESLPTIVLTPSGFRNSAQAIKMGAQYVVSKSTMDGELFAQKIYSSIERKRIENELRQKDNILQAVNYAAEVFLAQSNWESWIVEVLARLGQASQSDRVYVFRNSANLEKEDSINLHAEWASEGIRTIAEFNASFDSKDKTSGFFRWAGLLSKGQIIHGNVEDMPQTEQMQLMKMNVKSLIAVPILVDHTWWGFIGFDHCRHQKTWSADEIETLKTAARIFGAAISRQEAEEKLTHLATHDYLTGLPNRMLFTDRFNLALARSIRSSEKIAVISVDLDKFKAVNDTFGHPVGDRVLIETANRFVSALRASDTCARIGGDEFGVLTEGIHNKADVMRVMEKMTAALKNPIIENDKEIWISASMGAALYPDNGKVLEVLMNMADKALYQVKEKRSSFKIYNDEQYSWLKD